MSTWAYYLSLRSGFVCLTTLPNLGRSWTETGLDTPTIPRRLPTGFGWVSNRIFIQILFWFPGSWFWHGQEHGSNSQQAWANVSPEIFNSKRTLEHCRSWFMTCVMASEMIPWCFPSDSWSYKECSAVSYAGLQQVNDCLRDDLTASWPDP